MAVNYPSESKKRTTWILNCAGNSCKEWRKGNRGEFEQKPRVDFRTQHGGQERRVSITKSVLHRLKEWSLLHQKHMLRENMPSVILFAMMRSGKIAVETKGKWQGNGMTMTHFKIFKFLFRVGKHTVVLSSEEWEKIFHVISLHNLNSRGLNPLHSYFRVGLTS